MYRIEIARATSSGEQGLAMSRFMIPAVCLAALCVTGAVSAADDEGELAFNKHCRNCHSAKPGDNRLGPSLHGIVGGPAGQVEGYGKYSGALEGITWDEATLDRFIADPRPWPPARKCLPS